MWRKGACAKALQTEEWMLCWSIGTLVEGWNRSWDWSCVKGDSTGMLDNEGNSLKNGGACMCLGAGCCSRALNLASPLVVVVYHSTWPLPMGRQMLRVSAPASRRKGTTATHPRYSVSFILNICSVQNRPHNVNTTVTQTDQIWVCIMFKTLNH